MDLPAHRKEGSLTKLDVRDRIAYLTLDRPDALNGIDEGMLEALPRALAAVRDDPSVKALVITGAGDAFCVGLDIGLLGRAFSDTDYFVDVVQRLKAILLDLEALPVPTIAAVNGLARAGGFELMLACDMAVVADEAKIGDTHLSFGVVPGGGATVRAPQRLGKQRARELIFSGRWLSGAQAASMGLALRSVPRASLSEAVEAVVEPLRGWSRECLAATKAALNAAEAAPSHLAALDAELEAFERYLREVPTASEGYRAYVEERKPVWD